uniref:Ig-like domain-containing protein n=1 Tax=Pygocentrus nattereri TaxID=42514 RepID=A0A3B4DTI1_PYGNA
ISQSGLQYIQYGKEIILNCSFLSPDEATTTWFRHAPGEKPLLIASAYHYIPAVYYNGFDKTGRFKVLKEKNSFNLRISNAEPSDSATYYCSVAYYTDTALADWTVLILKGRCSSLSLSAVLQPPVSDPVELGGDTTLQCSILTDVSAGDHSVYWFRHGSGESHPGIIYTHGNRSDECKKSSETDSPTQSCVYKLPKRNLSLSDAGTYYCAVLMCGEIIFGNGTKLDFVGECKYFGNIKPFQNIFQSAFFTFERTEHSFFLRNTCSCEKAVAIVICVPWFLKKKLDCQKK